jgi:hypothetical protein
MLQLSWAKRDNGDWCRLLALDTSQLEAEGVYLIWHGGDRPGWLWVGKGNIAARIEAHRADPQIQVYGSAGLYVTWARVSPGQQEGIESFLGAACNPLFGTRGGGIKPIPVNLPGK